MRGACGKRFAALFSCIFTIGAAGCAEFGGAPSWGPFGSQATDGLPGVVPPQERIATLRKLAQRAPGANPEKKQRVSAQLAEAIRSEEDPAIRGEIVHALGEYPSAEADSVLRAALSDPDKDVRQMACAAWAGRGDAEAATVLGGVLRSDIDTDVRLAAARALGQTKHPAAVAALGEVLEDRDPAMQYRAVKSLRKITGEDFGNDVNQWRQYVRGDLPKPPRPISIAERLRRMF